MFLIQSPTVMVNTKDGGIHRKPSKHTRPKSSREKRSTFFPVRLPKTIVESRIFAFIVHLHPAFQSVRRERKEPRTSPRYPARKDVTGHGDVSVGRIFVGHPTRDLLEDDEVCRESNQIAYKSSLVTTEQPEESLLLVNLATTID